MPVSKNLINNMHEMLLLSKQRQFSFHLFSKYPIGRDLYFSRSHFHSSTKLTNQRGNNEIKSKATYQNKRKEYQSKKNLLVRKFFSFKQNYLYIL